MSWPMLLDLCRDDCKRILRRLELEGYSAVLSAFRAQGDLTKEKKKVLQDLQCMLSISTERHRAEVRRAVNDEKFATIAHNIAGSNSTSEWLIEGRRLIPLMPRLVPQTAFTVTANQVANAQAEKNAMLPFPKNTAGREVASVPVYSASASMSSVGTSTSKISRPSSPTSNVVVLPSGASIHIKGVLHPDEDEELQTRKRRRSQSSDNINLSSVSTQTPRIAYSSTPQPSHNTMSPVKITISKSPQSRSISSTSHTQPPKVILVTSSGQSMTPTVLHKSVSVPIVRASTATSTAISGINRASMMPSSSPVTISSASVVTVSSSSFTSPTSSVSTNSVLMSPVFHPSVAGKPRYRTIPRQRFPTQHKPGVVIPMSSQPVHPSPQSLSNIQVKTLSKPTIQIKQDGGMKIITQNIQGTTSKILPKPSHLTSSSSSGTPVVVVNTGSGSQTSKVLNISTPGGRVIATTKSNVVTVNPKAIQLTAVKTAGGTTVSKPNVIVVQKTQQRRPHTPTMISKSSSTVLANPTAFEKELVTFIQKQEGNPGVNISQSTSTLPSGKIGERKVIITTASTGASKLGGNLMPKNKAESEGRTSSLLAELIQAAGIVPTDAPLETTSGGVTSSVGGNEWIEYDVTEEQAQALAASGSTDPATLQAILGLSSSQPHQEGMEEKPPDDQREVIEMQPEQQISSQGNYFTLEQAMKLLEQSNSSSATTSDDKSEQYTVTVTQSEKDIDNLSTTSPTVMVEQSLQLNLPQTKLIEDRKVDAIKQIKPSPVQQFDGDLDPETGLFYTQPKPLNEEENSATSKSSADLDLIRSSLKEADINLDTFQYVVHPTDNKEGSPSPKVADSQNTQFAVSVSLTEDHSQHYQNEKEDIQELDTEIKREVSTAIVPVEEMEELISTPESADNKAVPPVTLNSQQVTSTASDTGAGDSNLANVETNSDADIVTMKTSAGDALPEKLASDNTITDISNFSETTSNLIPNASTELTYCPKTSSEEKDTVSGVDRTQKNIAQSQDAGEENLLHASQSSLGSSSDSQSEGDLLRSSKRKRKHPLTMDEVQILSVSSSPSQAGWVRSAAGLLLKVSKYRGLNREKGELNAAAWFTQPVDPADAPDYYSIVKNPMDFGTIRKKLESGMYKEFEDFHSDMLLVKDNCFLYNPPTSPVRGDCTDVFNFYQIEADKLKEKWQKSHIGSPLSKKPRQENKSPSKS